MNKGALERLQERIRTADRGCHLEIHAEDACLQKASQVSRFWTRPVAWISSLDQPTIRLNEERS